MKLSSFETIQKLSQSSPEFGSNSEGDKGVLALTLFFVRLHLHAINGKSVPEKHRAVYSCRAWRIILEPLIRITMPSHGDTKSLLGGGTVGVTIGRYMVDAYLLRTAGVAMDEWRPNDFAAEDRK